MVSVQVLFTSLCGSPDPTVRQGSIFLKETEKPFYTVFGTDEALGFRVSGVFWSRFGLPVNSPNTGSYKGCFKASS